MALPPTDSLNGNVPAEAPVATADGSQQPQSPATDVVSEGSADSGSENQAGQETPEQRAERLQKDFDTYRAETRQFVELRDFIQADPELRRMVERKLNGLPLQEQQPQHKQATGLARAQQILAETLEDQHSAKAIGQALELAVEEAVANAVGRVDPALRQFGRITMNAQYERSLTASGVTAEEQNTPAFEQHVRHLHGQKSFAALVRSDPDFAGQMTAQLWRGKQGQRDLRVSDKNRVDMAKSASTTAKSARSNTPITGERFKLGKHDLHGLRELFAKGVKREQIDIT